ncbi:hypothetical protein V1477_011630 [Vespula maculifrons]|uniref:Uncharacterized protein n=1 Tax=Vespula maculifrons TaxID=7453 RepID=A0ABD2BZQ9_VESMC
MGKEDRVKQTTNYPGNNLVDGIAMAKKHGFNILPLALDEKSLASKDSTFGWGSECHSETSLIAFEEINVEVNIKIKLMNEISIPNLEKIEFPIESAKDDTSEA